MIPEKAINVGTGSTEGEKPSFRFTHADDHRHQLWAWNTDEIKDLVRALKKLEGHTWAQIKSSSGLRLKVIDNPPALPVGVPKDATITELRVCQTKRIFGYRSDSAYYLVWFDRTHSVCPE